MSNLQKTIDNFLRDPINQARLDLRIPHLMLGNRVLGQFLTREVVTRTVCKGFTAEAEEYERSRIRRNTHPDFYSHFLNPGSKIADARELVDVLEKNTLQSDNFNVMISGFDYLNARSQDVLLKQLEETKVRSFLLIQALEPIVATIKSRSHFIRLPNVDIPTAFEIFKYCGFDNQQICLAALNLSRGDIDRALYWLNDPPASEFVKSWRKGPEEGLRLLLDPESRVEAPALDALYTALKHYLTAAKDNKRSLDFLRVLPKRYQAGLITKLWLTDQFLMISSGWYGESLMKK